MKTWKIVKALAAEKALNSPMGRWNCIRKSPNTRDFWTVVDNHYGKFIHDNIWYTDVYIHSDNHIYTYVKELKLAQVWENVCIVYVNNKLKT